MSDVVGMVFGFAELVLMVARIVVIGMLLNRRGEPRTRVQASVDTRVTGQTRGMEVDRHA